MNVRAFLNSVGGRVGVGVLLLAAIGGVVYSVRSNFGTSDAETLSATRTFVCSKTGKPFKTTLSFSSKIPVRSPHSGENTGFPAELCFWTRDGQTKTEPTAVLLNETIDKTGPTFCPDCGRLVVGHNPPPGERKNPPPTEAEFQARPRN